MAITKGTKPMTDQEATDEAVLLLVRKMRRTQPDAFAALWPMLPEGARLALQRADIRADVRRDHNETVWPVEPSDEDYNEE